MNPFKNIRDKLTWIYYDEIGDGDDDDDDDVRFSSFQCGLNWMVLEMTNTPWKFKIATEISSQAKGKKSSNHRKETLGYDTRERCS